MNADHGSLDAFPVTTYPIKFHELTPVWRVGRQRISRIKSVNYYQREE